MRATRASLINKATTALAELSITGRIIFSMLVVLFIASAIWMLYDINAAFLVTIPKHGGTLAEGVVGQPQFINPVLASTDADKDLSALVYSGLTRWDVQSQTLIPDLAQSWTISPDGLTYTFILKSGLTFQDGTPLSADDVVFTIDAIQNPDMKSPEQANWAGVTVQAINAHTIVFTLPSPYAPFIQNTTIGILPQHIWQNIDAAQFPFAGAEIHPVGSGPFEISKITTGKDGLPTEYALSPFNGFTLGQPYIGTITFTFYESQEDIIGAAEAGTITDLTDVAPEDVAPLQTAGFSIERYPLGRVFGLFFNQGQNAALADQAVRKALDVSINRQTIVATVFDGFANSVNTPVPPLFLGGLSASETVPTASTTIADGLLDKAGWIKNNSGIREKKIAGATTTLAFSISTSDAPELVTIANMLAEQWRQIGANVSVKVFGDGLQDSVIKPRDFDALLFGQVIGRGLDLYPFWASSQAADPGLNVSQYQNRAADTLLSEMREQQDPATQVAEYQAFSALIANDEPAVFVYEPELISAEKPLITGRSQGAIAGESERWNDAYRWYMETEQVWSVFAKTTY